MNDAFVLVIAAGYGALIGSFLNVCIFRLPRRCLRLWKPKLSFCPQCARSIPWHENVPILSFVLLRGRCKGCKAPIPVRYWIVELATTAWFLLVADQLLTGEEKRWALAVLADAAFCVLLVFVLIRWDLRTNRRTGDKVPRP